MIPRAEIAMVITAKGLQLGSWAVPAVLYSSMVMVYFFTSIATPLTLRYLLKDEEKQQQ